MSNFELFGCRPQCCANSSDGKDIRLNANYRGDAGMSLDSLPGPPDRDMPVIASRVSAMEIRGEEDLDAVAERMMVGGGNDRDVIVQAPSPKTQEEMRLLVTAVKKNFNLQAALSLSDKLCNEMVEMAWKESFDAGTDVVEEGDLNGDYYYIVQEGTLDVFVKGKNVLSIKKGGSFGELALLYFAPRAATVTTTSDCVLWMVDRCHFKAILAKAAELHLSAYAKHLRSLDVMEGLTKRQRLEVANALTEMHYEGGDTVYGYGERGDSVYMFFDGDLSLRERGGIERDRQTARSRHPLIMGEKGLSSGHPRDHSLVIKSPTAAAVMMDKTTFELLMAKAKLEKENKKKLKQGLPISRFGVHEYCTEEWKIRHQDPKRLKDLQVIGPLGVGAFGLVELVEHLPTNTCYALKTMSKGYIQISGLQSSVLFEKNVQFMCDSPFIVKLVDTFTTAHSVSFLMEVVLGGDLMHLFTKKHFWGNEEYIKFYCAGVILAFQHMHPKCIVYRDLKAENVLIDASGAPKLCDMGLAKLSPGKTYTTCGALVNMSPEVIKCTGHNRGTDWWTLGVMIFELMSKTSPFDGKSPVEIYSKIFKGMEKVEFPPVITNESELLIKSLCHQLVHKRCPMTIGGVNNVKKHAWYHGFDWVAMESQGMAAPFKPTIKGKKDMSNFRRRPDADVPMQMPYVDDGNDWDSDFATSS